MKIINIYEIINSRLAVFHNEGIEIYNEIESTIKRGEETTVSFKNLKVVTSQFLSASIGNLHYKNDQSQINLITLIDTEHIPNLNEKIKTIINYAIKQKEESK